MAIAPVGTATGSSSVASGLDTLTWSFTNSAAGNLLFVACGAGASSGDNSVTGVTYAAVSLTAELWDADENNWSVGACWYKNGSLATGANNVVIDFAGVTSQLFGIACTFESNSGGSLSLGATATPSTSTSGTTPSVTMSSATGRVVFASLSSDGNSITGRTGTLPSGTAEINDIGSGDTCIGVQYYAGAASVTAQWTTSGSNGGVAGAVEIIETGGGGGAALQPFMIGDLSGVGSPGRFLKDPLQ